MNTIELYFFLNLLAFNKHLFLLLCIHHYLFNYIHLVFHSLVLAIYILRIPKSPPKEGGRQEFS